MYPRLSNRASLSQIEKEFDLRFHQPHIYEPTPVIDGSSQSMVPVIKDLEATNILFGLWGIPPEDPYRTKQNFLIPRISNTQDDSAFCTMIKDRRCLIIVSGFFTYFVREEVLQPYFVHLPDHTPFSLAGLYSESNDGKLSCSYLMTPNKSILKQVPNGEKLMPLVIPGTLRNIWLDKNTPLSGMETIINAVEPPNFMFYRLPNSLLD